MRYDTDDDLDFDVGDLLPALNQLDRKLACLEAGSGRVGLTDPELQNLLPHLEALDRRLNRVSSATNTLLRTLQRQRDNADMQTKSRPTPKVMKTLNLPGEGSQLLRDGRAAMAAGPIAYRHWLLRQREIVA